MTRFKLSDLQIILQASLYGRSFRTPAVRGRREFIETTRRSLPSYGPISLVAECGRATVDNPRRMKKGIKERTTCQLRATSPELIFIKRTPLELSSQNMSFLAVIFYMHARE